ncbi:uncharacterized protein LACBIDRAFT_336101 [Laccaria bicolor S238N-H82]|uniref:Predicted protein n=1 Tax=Laccaria bicolor (strain S238N-H82 / ATCC MYA-4686) TaxID=486041 RepID=B0E4E2_LACBS|nr:uncharacterized protein LACBIDRAFT_336101 [Laccaria bicolor S238N-H82]EDQ98289.1 predicted protein [Laccaria bicolor S238N-H82]|eukprot:XP_001891060.1 predicted protein [Laccaria bicolor S238N-H82]
MSIPHNALPAAVKLRESALTAFKTYQDMKEGLNSAAAPTILGVAANYCVQLIDTKDPCLLMHQPMHNVLFLVRGEYNTRSTGVHAIAPPADLDTIKEYCRAVLAARAAAQVVPPPVTAQAQAQAEIAERGYILKQRPRKLVKSKAVVEDKDDEVEIVPGPSDTDMVYVSRWVGFPPHVWFVPDNAGMFSHTNHRVQISSCTFGCSVSSSSNLASRPGEVKVEIISS